VAERLLGLAYIARGELGADEASEVVRLDADDRRHLEDERLASHGQRDIEAAGADREHAHPARGRRVRVTAEERLAGCGEALEVDLVADAVAGAREMRPEARGCGLQESVIVRILEAGLQHVVVDVRDRELVAHALDAECFELQPGERAGGVLGQGVVDPDGDLVARDERSGDEVLLKDGLGHGSGHDQTHSSLLPRGAELDELIAGSLEVSHSNDQSDQGSQRDDGYDGRDQQREGLSGHGSWLQ